MKFLLVSFLVFVADGGAQIVAGAENGVGTDIQVPTKPEPTPGIALVSEIQVPTKPEPTPGIALVSEIQVPTKPEPTPGIAPVSEIQVPTKPEPTPCVASVSEDGPSSVPEVDNAPVDSTRSSAPPSGPTSSVGSGDFRSPQFTGPEANLQGPRFQNAGTQSIRAATNLAVAPFQNPQAAANFGPTLFRPSPQGPLVVGTRVGGQAIPNFQRPPGVRVPFQSPPPIAAANHFVDQATFQSPQNRPSFQPETISQQGLASPSHGRPILVNQPVLNRVVPASEQHGHAPEYGQDPYQGTNYGQYVLIHDPYAYPGFRYVWVPRTIGDRKNNNYGQRVNHGGSNYGHTTDRGQYQHHIVPVHHGDYYSNGRYKRSALPVDKLLPSGGHNDGTSRHSLHSHATCYSDHDCQRYECCWLNSRRCVPSSLGGHCKQENDERFCNGGNDCRHDECCARKRHLVPGYYRGICERAEYWTDCIRSEENGHQEKPGHCPGYDVFHSQGNYRRAVTYQVGHSGIDYDHEGEFGDACHRDYDCKGRNKCCRGYCRKPAAFH